MIEKRNEHIEADPGVSSLRGLSPAEFAALGGSAVAFIRPIAGSALAEMIQGAAFEDEMIYQLVMSADGTPLLVADTPEAVGEWLGNRNVGLVSVH